MPEDEGETIYVSRTPTGRSAGVYHTDPDCPQLRDGRPATRAQFPTLDLCTRCGGDYHRDSEYDWSAQHAAWAARADGGTAECGRRTCDREAAVTYRTMRGAMRTRCPKHALADGVDGVGEAYAERLLEALTLADLVEVCGEATDSLAPAALRSIDGIGAARAAEIAQGVDESPVAEAIRSDRDDGGDDQEVRADGGQPVRSEWRLVCTDCDFEDQLVAEGHPREGPPKAVEKRVREHKGTTDWSHIVRVEGRLADRDDSIDPSLVTDGGHGMLPEDRLNEAAKQVRIVRQEVAETEGERTVLAAIETRIRGVREMLAEWRKDADLGEDAIPDGGVPQYAHVDVGDRVIAHDPDGSGTDYEAVVATVHSPETIDVVINSSREGPFERDSHTDEYRLYTSLVYGDGPNGWALRWGWTA